MNRLLKVLKKVKPDEELEKYKNLVDEGILDSLEIVEIITAIEEEFSIVIKPEQIDPDNFQSVDSMWTMIQQALV